jgi:hypothetical protein
MSTLRERIESRLRERIQAAEQSSFMSEPGSASPGGTGFTEAGSDKLDLGPLFAHLDELIQVVESIRDFSVEPYRERVREIVCSTCRQDGSGQCATRAAARCGMDKHFDTIVAVIEQELKNEGGGL